MVAQETILVVEDTDEVRKLICRILAEHGYKVLEAADGDEALQVSEAHDHGIHLLLTDMVMPRMNGGELAERLRSLIPSLRMIFMSGYTDSIRIHQGGQVTTFLAKPFTPHALARKVREVLDAPTAGEERN